MRKIFKVVAWCVAVPLGAILAFVLYDANPEGFKSAILWFGVPVLAFFVVNDWIVKPIKAEFYALNRRLDSIERRITNAAAKTDLDFLKR